MFLWFPLLKVSENMYFKKNDNCEIDKSSIVTKASLKVLERQRKNTRCKKSAQ